MTVHEVKLWVILWFLLCLLMFSGVSTINMFSYCTKRKKMYSFYINHLGNSYSSYFKRRKILARHSSLMCPDKLRTSTLGINGTQMSRFSQIQSSILLMLVLRSVVQGLPCVLEELSC